MDGASVQSDPSPFNPGTSSQLAPRPGIAELGVPYATGSHDATAIAISRMQDNIDALQSSVRGLTEAVRNLLPLPSEGVTPSPAPNIFPSSSVSRAPPVLHTGRMGPCPPAPDYFPLSPSSTPNTRPPPPPVAQYTPAFTPALLQKLIYTTGLSKEEFFPRSEKEYDDLLDGYERRVGPDSYPYLSSILLQIGSPRVVRIIETLPYDTRRNWEVCRDALARRLFVCSAQMKELVNSFARPDRKGTVEEALCSVEAAKKRHTRLITRWNQGAPLDESALIDCLLLRVPQRIVDAIFQVEWKMGTFEELADRCSNLEVSATIRRALGIEAETKAQSVACFQGYQLASLKVDEDDEFVETHRVDAMTPEKDRRCYKCRQKGHWATDCRDPIICNECGKFGHTAESCKKIEIDTGAGKVQAYLRETTNGLFLSLNTQADKVAWYKYLSQQMNEESAKVAKARDRAKEKREEKKKQGITFSGEKRRREGSLSQGAHHEEEADEEESAEAHVSAVSTGYDKASNEYPGILSASTQISDKRWYTPIVISGVHCLALIDTGANVNILTRREWNRLPEDVRRLSRQPSVAKERRVVGCGGAQCADHVVSLVVEISDTALKTTFWVLDFDHNIIGMPLLSSLGAVFDCTLGRLKCRVTNDVRPLDLLNPDDNASPESCAVGPSLQVAEDNNDEQMVRDIINPELSVDDITQLMQVFQDHTKVWQHTSMGDCDVVEHHIDTGSSPPIADEVRRMSPDKREEAIRQTKDLLQAGAIERSHSPWRSALVFVPKKGGAWRMCIDYRKLNEVTVKDKYPLPRIDEVILSLGGSKYFTSIDLKSGYHLIRLTPESKEKTAFHTPLGLFQYKVMPFGLCNAPATFQRAIDTLLGSFRLQGVECYLDDIVIHSHTIQEHVQLLGQVLAILGDHGFYINVPKTRVAYQNVEILGFQVSPEGYAPNPTKLQALNAMSPPTSVSGVRRFLGLVGYFRRFIRNFASRAAPVTMLLRKGLPWRWTDYQQAAFEDLRDALKDEPVLLHFPTREGPWTIDTDASGIAIAAILLQDDRPISFASRLLTDAEAKWSTHEHEALAIVWGVHYFAEFVRGTSFLVRTDHQSLQWLWKSQNKRVIRWALSLQEFTFTIEYQKSTKHAHVDVFTRNLEPTEMESYLNERIATRAKVYAITPAVPTLKWTDPVESGFPQVEEVANEQAKERAEDPNVCKSLQRQGILWVTKGGRIYIPKSLRSRILFYFHFSRSGGHQGINRTHGRLSHEFWWPKMRTDVEEFVKQCLACKRLLVPSRARLLGDHAAFSPGRMVAMDFTGPYGHNERQYTILTIIDHFTRYADAVPIDLSVPLTSANVWQIFFTRWVAVWGCPEAPSPIMPRCSPHRNSERNAPPLAFRRCTPHLITLKVMLW